MQIIVGLGNPGLKYKKTRHNIGFRVLDAIRKENDFPKFKSDKKLKAEITKGVLNGKEVLLVKPQTFMNSSGLSVASLTTNYQIPTTNLIVVHDDFDLPLGEIKIVENSSSGGHHGVQSIIDTLKTQNFTRLKIGIRPISNCMVAKNKNGYSDNRARSALLQIANLENQKLKAEDFVLKKFSKQEESAFSQVIKKSCQAITSLLGS